MNSQKLDILVENINKYVQTSAQDRTDRLNELKKMTKINEDLTQSMKGLLDKLEGYIDGGSKAIENEINERLTTYLQNPQNTIFKNKFIYSVHKDWKFLNTPEKDSNGNKWKNRNQITEFDGLYIVSDQKLDNVQGLISEPSLKQQNSKTNKLFFIVLEGKHTLDTEKLNHKISKIKEFKNYITKAKAIPFNQETYTQEFLRKREQYYLQLASETVYVYFAGPLLQQSAIDHIHNNKDTWKKDNIIANYLKPDGSQYTMYEMFNNFTAFKLTVSNEVTVQGGKKKTSSVK